MQRTLETLHSTEWADSLLIAQTLKAFLQQLPEPILTYRLYRDFISAASQPHTSLDLLSELPLVSLNTFEVLLETCHRLTRHPERNGVSTRRLVTVEAQRWNLSFKSRVVFSAYFPSTPVAFDKLFRQTQSYILLIICK